MTELKKKNQLLKQIIFWPMGSAQMSPAGQVALPHTLVGLGGAGEPVLLTGSQVIALLLWSCALGNCPPRKICRFLWAERCPSPKSIH